MVEDKLLKWFKNEILECVLKNECFTKNNEVFETESCHFEDFEKGIDNFASVPCFASVRLKKGGKKSFLIKFQSQDDIVREKMKLTIQFQNEITFYNVVLQDFSNFLAKMGTKSDILAEIFPKCYFAHFSNEPAEKSIIVLEDLRESQFTMSACRVDMDLDHCLTALKALASFHAISFAMKFLNWTNFEYLKTSFEHVWYSDDEATRQQCHEFKRYTARRGIDYLLAQTDRQVPETYLETLETKLESLFDVLKDAISPTEPLSVICHGDFNRNNIMFKYEQGKAVQAKLIDLQTYLYGSPCLDLSFFIYMNTAPDFRTRHFQQIFQYYYSTLIGTVASITQVEEDTISQWIPMSLFEKDMERVAINAYSTVSFFLPAMMAPIEVSFDQVLQEKTFKQMAEDNYKQGGDRVSERIAQVILDFYSRGFYL